MLSPSRWHGCLSLSASVSTSVSSLASALAYLCIVFMPPTSKKLEGHIASRAFVRPFVHSSVRLFIHLSRFLMHSITLEPCMLLF